MLLLDASPLLLLRGTEEELWTTEEELSTEEDDFSEAEEFDESMLLDPSWLSPLRMTDEELRVTEEEFAETILLLDTLVSLSLDFGVTLEEDASSQSSHTLEEESSEGWDAKSLSSSPQAISSAVKSKMAPIVAAWHQCENFGLDPSAFGVRTTFLFLFKAIKPHFCKEL